MKTLLQKFTLLTFIVIILAPANPEPDKAMLKELNLTDSQKEQFQKITFDTQKKQIELKAKLETSELELRRLMTAETIDKSAIEKKMNEVATNRVAMQMNRINGWIEKNKILNAEQQKIWKQHLVDRPKPMRDRMKHKGMMRGEMRHPMQREIIKERIRN